MVWRKRLEYTHPLEALNVPCLIGPYGKGTSHPRPGPRFWLPQGFASNVTPGSSRIYFGSCWFVSRTKHETRYRPHSTFEAKL